MPTYFREKDFQRSPWETGKQNYLRKFLVNMEIDSWVLPQQVTVITLALQSIDPTIWVDQVKQSNTSSCLSQWTVTEASTTAVKSLAYWLRKERVRYRIQHSPTDTRGTRRFFLLVSIVIVKNFWRQGPFKSKSEKTSDTSLSIWLNG